MRIIIDIVENCVGVTFQICFGTGVLQIGIIAMNRKLVREISLRELIVDDSICRNDFLNMSNVK